MVNTIELRNKDEKIMKTKAGETLKEHTFAVGDEFIPEYNGIIEKSKEAIVEGKKKIIFEYTLKCKVKGFNNQEPVFVKLTPTQANSIKNKLKNKEEINQNLWIAYQYTGKDSNKYVGIGYKNANKKAKTFEDFQETEN